MEKSTSWLGTTSRRLTSLGKLVSQVQSYDGSKTLGRDLTLGEPFGALESGVYHSSIKLLKGRHLYQLTRLTVSGTS